MPGVIPRAAPVAAPVRYLPADAANNLKVSAVGSSVTIAAGASGSADSGGARTGEGSTTDTGP